MPRKHKYTLEQRRAFDSGRGYSFGYNNRAIPFKKAENKQSFMDGFRAGQAAMKKNPKRYGPNKRARNK